MANEWPIVNVGELADSISETHQFDKDKLIFLNTSDVLFGKILHQTYSVVRDWPGQAKKSIQRNDILFSEIRPANGRWAYVDIDAKDFVVSTKLMVIRSRVGKVVPRFLYHFLTSTDTTRWLQHLAESRSGTFPQITFDQVAELELALPPLAAQATIAAFLDGIAARIELNQQLNITLGAMGRTIFKSWFVDFDPVRAKVEGREIGLPKNISDLFPDSFDDSDLGEIPKGWKVGSLDEEFNLIMGQSPPGETYNEIGDGLPFFQGRTDFGFRFPVRRVYCSAPTRFAEKGDTLVSVRAPVGDINMSTERCCIGRGVAAVRHKTGARSFTYYSMDSLEDAFMRFEAEGTVFGSIGKKDFHALASVTPTEDIVAVFERVVGALDDRLQLNEEQSHTLAALRDTLLPKLISGELQLKDAEKYIGRHV